MVRTWDRLAYPPHTAFMANLDEVREAEAERDQPIEHANRQMGEPPAVVVGVKPKAMTRVYKR